MMPVIGVSRKDELPRWFIKDPLNIPGARLFEGTRLTIRYFFDAVGVKYTEELLIRGVDSKGEIKDHPTALADAYALGEKLAEPTTSSSAAADA